MAGPMVNPGGDLVGVRALLVLAAANGPLDGWQIALIAAVALLALAAVTVAAAGLITNRYTRISVTDNPRTRRNLARSALASGPTKFHHADDAADLASVASGLAAIKTRDPAFHEIAVVEAAHRALFFAFVMQTTGDRRRLEQVTTGQFWQSAVGTTLQEQAAVVTASRRRTGLATGRQGGDITQLDFQAGEVTVMGVEAATGGLDRLRLRVAYRSRSVVTGAQAALMAEASGTHGALRTAQEPYVGPNGIAQLDRQGWYDLDIIRPTTAQSEGNEDGWRCNHCGAPFHTDLDVSCPNCQAKRTPPEGAWLIDRSWLVID